MSLGFWSKKRISITGGRGFVGFHLIDRLKELGCRNIFAPTSKEYDLTKEQDVKRFYCDFEADIVIHLAVAGGGIGANQKNRGKFFYDNIMMGTLLMEYARRNGVKKFVGMGTVCSYPKFTPTPFKEENLWNGYPEETNAPYGLAKKMMIVQSQAYREQYGFSSINLLSANLYGPKDNFDLETSHVIPALIRKCVDAIEEKRDEIVVWGTGNVSREFLYVKDCVEGLLLATEHYDKSEPVNLGSGEEIFIKDLVDMIVKLTGFKGRIIWDKSKPDGQPKRCVDTQKAEIEFGFKAKTSLKEGLLETIEWYRRNYEGKFNNSYI